MKATSFLIAIFVILVLVQCNPTDKLELTSEYLAGNWYYIDSICAPDPEFDGYSYGEVCFNDTIFIHSPGGMGPTYTRYKIRNDSIIFENANDLAVIDFESNTMRIEFFCDQKAEFLLTRMGLHDKPLKEFYSSNDADDFSIEILKRQHSKLVELGLIE
jgi:hypothetical protein